MLAIGDVQSTGLKLAWAALWTAALSLAAASFAATPTSSGDPTSREIARTIADSYLEVGNARAAEQALTDHLATDPADAWSWHLRGLVRLRARRPREAAADFGRAASGATRGTRGMHLYYEGLAYARSGDRESAGRALAAAAREPVTASDAEQALSTLRRNGTVEELAARSPGTGSLRFSLTSGYDSNVLLRSDAALASVTATGAASPRFLLAARGAYSKRRMLGGVFNASGSLAYDFHSERAVRALDSLAAGAVVGLAGTGEGLLGLEHRMLNAFSVGFLNRSGLGFYSWSDSLRWTGARRLGYGRALEIDAGVQYQRFTVQTGDLAANDRSGPVAGGGVTYRFEREVETWSAGLRAERQLSKGDNFKATSLEVPLRWTRSELPWSLEATVDLTPAMIRYTSASSGRRDTLLDGSLSLGRAFRERIRGSLEYGFVRNLSSLAAASYLKHVAGIKVSYAFL